MPRDYFGIRIKAVKEKISLKTHIKINLTQAMRTAANDCKLESWEDAYKKRNRVLDEINALEKELRNLKEEESQHKINQFEVL